MERLCNEAGIADLRCMTLHLTPLHGHGLVPRMLSIIGYTFIVRSLFLLQVLATRLANFVDNQLHPILQYGNSARDVRHGRMPRQLVFKDALATQL